MYSIPELVGFAVYDQEFAELKARGMLKKIKSALSRYELQPYSYSLLPLRRKITSLCQRHEKLRAAQKESQPVESVDVGSAILVREEIEPELADEVIEFFTKFELELEKLIARTEVVVNTVLSNLEVQLIGPTKPTLSTGKILVDRDCFYREQGQLGHQVLAYEDVDVAHRHDGNRSRLDVDWMTELPPRLDPQTVRQRLLANGHIESGENLFAITSSKSGEQAPFPYSKTVLPAAKTLVFSRLQESC